MCTPTPMPVRSVLMLYWDHTYPPHPHHAPFDQLKLDVFNVTTD